MSTTSVTFHVYSYNELPQPTIAYRSV